MDQATIDQLRAELAEHSMFELLGGADGLRRVVDDFYDLMDTDPLFAPIRTMHDSDLTAIKDGLFAYLAGWLGAPPQYAQRPGARCIGAAHAPFMIDERARDLWVECMHRSMVAGGLADRYREALMPALAQMADALRNV
ncbi:MAG: group II truncated hemoglobin [Ilumatobacteraceae bacterium]|nr:group II truncated hemoglobin [Acidimicrobiales bacterium]MCB9393448.1 group II truncated hemoglobin [Acidimicrobiaceae bacterium]